MPSEKGLPAVRRPQQKGDGYASAVYNGLTAPENRSMITSIGLFAVRIPYITCKVPRRLWN